MVAVKRCSMFLIHFLLISTALSSSSEDFFSNYDEVEDMKDTQISSDNPSYSETSTHTGISEPYLVSFWIEIFTPVHSEIGFSFLPLV